MTRYYILRFALGFIVGATAAILVGILSHSERGFADHPYSPPWRLGGLHGSPPLAEGYSLCSDDPAIQQVWAFGPATWNNALLGDVTLFPFLGCDGDAAVVAQWEFAAFCPPSDAPACAQPTTSTFHSVGGQYHFHVTQAAVLYDIALYTAISDSGWRAQVSGHEWGHLLSLDHHANATCQTSQPRIMGLYSNFNQTPCGLTPTAAETCTAWTSQGYTTNTDAAPITAPGSPSDTTVARSDSALNGCDADDDNDGWIDTLEPFGCNGSGSMSRLLGDTDGDRARDGAECALGSNPTDANSLPSTTPPNDSDGDDLPDALEISLGSNPNSVDSNGDEMPDRVAYIGYSLNPATMDGDSDGCPDDVEITSINSDSIVNSGDQLSLANAILAFLAPPYPNYPLHDINKNGRPDSGDQLQIAKDFNETC